ncbi:MAG: serine/threonine-protein kinase [FCB group bacterium]|jgi:serine/threonine protein kinase|nr:serine/threonine-protein kinase [FCB group bacterium]
MNVDETIPMSFVAGNRVGKYRILRELGRGGMGVVYLAEDTTLGRMVALKVLRTSWPDDPELFAKRFRIEARAVAALNHPNIVRIHALDTLAGRLTIDMEYVEAGSLAERIGSEPIPIATALHVGHDILQALSQCHSLGIVHRDVKPSNALVDAQGKVRLTDFGLAKAMSEHVELVLRTGASSYLFLGTPRYAPPEAWNGVSPTPSWDIYSVGLVLYEALTGEVPFKATNPLALMKQVTTMPVPRVEKKSPAISAEFAALVHDMLSVNPEERPIDGRRALERLEAVPEFATVNTASLPAFVQRRRPQMQTTSYFKRMRGVRSGLFTALVGVLMALGTFFYGWKQEYGSKVNFDPIAQAAAFREGLPTKANLLHLSKASDSSSSQQLAVHLLEEPESKPRWLMTGASGGNPVIFAYEDSHLSVLNVDMRPDRSLRVQGQWAEYDASLGNVFRTGKVSGSGYWPSSDAPLTAALNYVCEDGSRWTRTATATPQRSVTDTLFIHGLEDSPFLQPLLYNELLKRMPFWAGPFEEMLPCVAGQRTEAALLGGVRQGVKVDGVLNEPLWRERHFGTRGRIGIIFGRPGPNPPEMSLRWFGDGLLIGLKADSAVQANSELRLALLSRFAVPVQASDRWQATFRDGKWSEHRLLRQGVEQPWNCAWEAAVRSDRKQWEGEIFIPFSNLDGVSTPGTGDRWRLNCGVYEESQNGLGMVPRFQWGYPDETEVEHGAMIVFGRQPERVLKP